MAAASELTPLDSTELISSSLFHRRSGPLTHELLLTPGDFGLGQIPAKHKPDATTNMVCGYCSTGSVVNFPL